MTQRIDVWLAEYKMISRAKAQALIKNGDVLCNGKVVVKCGQTVDEKDEIVLKESAVLRYVSRGGLKLEKAIDVFSLDFTGKTVLDIGSSTGGFTDCALQHGAKKVIAIDVGTGVMDKTLASDPRVELHEQTDIRDFPAQRLGEVDYVVCDVSFISLLTAIAPLKDAPGQFDMVLLIKPQFECGVKIARRYKGVIHDPAIHKQILRQVVKDMQDLSFSLEEITFSPICGGDGNIEYLSRFSRRAAENTIDLDALVDTAFAQLKDKK